jgi:hypothetical protein
MVTAFISQFHIIGKCNTPGHSFCILNLYNNLFSHQVHSGDLICIFSDTNVSSAQIVNIFDKSQVIFRLVLNYLFTQVCNLCSVCVGRQTATDAGVELKSCPAVDTIILPIINTCSVFSRQSWHTTAYSDICVPNI